MLEIQELEGYTRIINITKQELDLDKTFNCGQAFRWKKQHNLWTSTLDNQLVILGQGVFKDGKEGLITNIKRKDCDSLLEYLDLNNDYTVEINKLELSEYEKRCFSNGTGIKILKQDLFEMIISFITSQCNTIHNIKNILNNITHRYGEEIQIDFMGEKFIEHTFPDKDTLYSLSLDDLKTCKLGFRSIYVKNFLNKLEEEKADLLSELHNSSYYEVMGMLKELDGIGDKVANCICLFGLHKLNAFPIDTHIKDILNREYEGQLPSWVNNKYAGVLQQYLFYNELKE